MSIVPNFPKSGKVISLAVSGIIFEIAPTDMSVLNRIKRHFHNSQLQNGQFILPSSAVWSIQSDSVAEHTTDKFEICAMTQERLFPSLIIPWLDYHPRIGNFFFIYDDGMPRNFSKELSNRKDLQIIDWPWQRSQIQAQNHFLLHGRVRCHWIVLFDVDEYIAIKQAGDLGKGIVIKQNSLRYLLRELKAEGYSNIMLNSIFMGSSGLLEEPKKAPPEVYVNRLHPTIWKSPKPLLYADHTFPLSMVHSVFSYVGYRRTTLSLCVEKNSTGWNAGIVHYSSRSWEEYNRKRNGPRNSFQVIEAKNLSNTNEKPTIAFLNPPGGKHFSDFRELYGEVMKLPILAPTILSSDEKAYNSLVKQTHHELSIKLSKCKVS